MSRRAALFTETDVKRAIRAATAAGWADVVLEIAPDGTLRLRKGEGAPIPAPTIDEPARKKFT